MRKTNVHKAAVILGSIRSERKAKAARENAKRPRPRGRRLTGDNHWSRKNPEKVARGSARHNALLTEEQVIGIRRLHKTKTLNGKQLATLFNVTPSSISCIVLRKQWGHV